MNRNIRLIGTGLLLATCSLALAVMEPMNLKFSPKEGDELKYKMSGVLQVMGQDATIAAEFDYKVAKVDKDGNYTMSSAHRNVQIEVAGQTINPPDSANTTSYKANGEISDFQGDTPDPNSWRMAELNNFVYPAKAVNVGDEWTSTVTADAKKGTVAATCTYKVDSLEKIGNRDTAKIKVTFKETEGTDPASSDGFVWIDTKDGSMVKSTAAWANFPSPQGPITATINMERID